MRVDLHTHRNMYICNDISSVSKCIFKRKRKYDSMIFKSSSKEMSLIDLQLVVLVSPRHLCKKSSAEFSHLTEKSCFLRGSEGNEWKISDPYIILRMVFALVEHMLKLRIHCPWYVPRASSWSWTRALKYYPVSSYCMEWKLCTAPWKSSSLRRYDTISIIDCLKLEK